MARFYGTLSVSAPWKGAQPGHTGEQPCTKKFCRGNPPHWFWFSREKEGGGKEEKRERGDFNEEEKFSTFNKASCKRKHEREERRGEVAA